MKLLKRLAERMGLLRPLYTVTCWPCGLHIRTTDETLALAALVDHLGHHLLKGTAK